MIVYRPWIIVLGLALDLTSVLIHWITGWKFISGFNFTGLCFTFWLMGLIVVRQTTGGISSRKPSPELQEAFHDLVRKFGLKDIGLVLCKSSRVNGALLRNQCFVTERSLDTLSQAGVEFLISHELAHAKFFSFRPASKKPPKVFLYTFVASCLLGSLCLRFQFPWYVYVSCLSPLITLMIYSTKVFPTTQSSTGQDMELACDYMALSIIRDPQASIEVMNLLNHGSRADRALGGHPSKERRLEQINNYLSGLPRSPYKNAFVEQGVESFLAEQRKAVS